MKNSRFLLIILPIVLIFGFANQGYAQTDTSGAQQVVVESSHAGLQNVKNQILSLINSERSKSEYKAAEIHSSEKLSHIAQAFANDMVARHFFNHVDPDGNTCRERAKRLKLSCPHAESILSGVLTGDEAVEEFMADPPKAQNSSRANILNPEFRSLGVGVAQKASGTLVIVLEFSKAP